MKDKLFKYIKVIPYSKNRPFHLEGKVILDLNLTGDLELIKTSPRFEEHIKKEFVNKLISVLFKSEDIGDTHEKQN